LGTGVLALLLCTVGALVAGYGLLSGMRNGLGEAGNPQGGGGFDAKMSDLNATANAFLVGGLAMLVIGIVLGLRRSGGTQNPKRDR
jgi:hypothetical protein